MTYQRDILPILGYGESMLRNVTVLIVAGFTPFELGVVCEVFGVDRTGDGLPGYDFAVVAGEPVPLRSAAGFTLDTPFGLDRLAAADLVVVSAATGDRLRRCVTEQFPEPLLEALRDTVDRGARVLS